MSLKKRMFRSNMVFLAYSLIALILVTAVVMLIFKEQFSREFESLSHARLDQNVLTAAMTIDQNQKDDWEGLARILGDMGYELVVAEKGSILYGDDPGEGEELLRDFNWKDHSSGKTEVFYLQGMTIIGKYDQGTERYTMAIGGTEVDWWMSPLKHSASTLFYVLIAVGASGAASLLILSGLFTRRLVRRITEPLEELERGAERIREGNLEEPVEYKGDEEFEQICQTFNDMQKAVLDAREQQKKNEQARTDMITGISHDLRTPLTSIQGYIKGIMDGVAGTKEKQDVYLKTAYNATKEMNVLLQKLFDFSRIESGQLPFHIIKGDLAEFTAAWIGQKEGEPDRIPAEFSFEKEQEVLPDIYMDIDQFRRIFENLLENSLKYAGVSPVKISIKVYTKKENVVLEWKDNGVGVPEEKLPHIFDRFYRCDEARTVKGSGVGLYVVKWIVNEHGGKIEAENQGGLLIKMHFPKGG